MNILDAIQAAATSGGAGVLGGLVGTVVGAVSRKSEREFLLREKRLDQSHLRRMQRMNMEQQGQKHANDVELKQMISDLRRDLSMDENLRSSYAHDSSIRLSPDSWVQKFRALIRPLGTSVSFILSWTVAIVLLLTSMEVKIDSLAGTLILSLHQLTVMAFVWWYGGRDSRGAIHPRKTSGT